MKLVRHSGEDYTFSLSAGQTRILRELLRLYPLIPETHYRLSRAEARGPDERERQELLSEAMEAQRSEHRDRAQRLAEDTQRFVRTDSAYLVTFNRSELEWLLQVLNDVRVGSWILLGSPDLEERVLPNVSAEKLRFVVAMETSGVYEYSVLQALESAPGPA